MNKQDLFCKNTEEIRRHIGDNSTVFLLLCIVETLLSPTINTQYYEKSIYL